MKEHLIGGKRNAKSCLKVTEDVRKEVQDFMDAKKKAKQVVDLNEIEVGDYDDDDEVLMQPQGPQPSMCGSTTSSLHRSDRTQKMKGPMDPMDVYLTPDPEIVVRKRKGRQPKIDENDGAKKELRRRACKAFAKWMYDAGIPFNAVNYPSFDVYVEAQGQYGPGMKPPSYHEVRVPLLKEEVEDAKQLMKAHEAEWVNYGCSLMCDGWEDRKHRTLVNFSVNTPRGSFFLESIDASAVAKTGDMLFEVICKYVEMIGPKNVVQVVTDSASNNKAAGRMLMTRYEHLFWTPCAAHCKDLMLEDLFAIERLNKCIRKAMKLNAFIYTKPGMVNMLREFTNQRVLIRPAKTRFATAFLTLSRINNQKVNIRNMFLSKKWLQSNYSKDPVGRQIACFVNQASFWNTIVCSLKVAGPLVHVLRSVDGEKTHLWVTYTKLWIGPRKRLNGLLNIKQRNTNTSWRSLIRGGTFNSINPCTQLHIISIRTITTPIQILRKIEK